MSFFSTREHTFAEVPLGEDGGVAARGFLNACADLVPVFSQ
jgi:hypothetical protein